MSDNDLIFFGFYTLSGNCIPVGICHFQAIDHYQCGYFYRHMTASEPQHFMQMSFIEKKSSGQLIVFFIKSAAGNKNANGHLNNLGLKLLNPQLSNERISGIEISGFYLIQTL